MKTRYSVTHDEVIEYLDYSPETGVFVWRKSRGSKCKVGEPAGHKRKTDYVAVCFFGTIYMAHRLAWFYANKEWPDGYIDHINGNPSDNRLSNLRLVTHRQNSENRTRPTKHNSSGLLGAHKSNKPNKPWEARIKVGDRRIFLGNFRTPEEAHRAYVEAKRSLHEGCTI